ncbi:hypothetical protein FM103_12120 [Corynebacterium xerosis]|nr:hypothetical protein FM103_12120 [Corynebacterium xerosis]
MSRTSPVRHSAMLGAQMSAWGARRRQGVRRAVLWVECADSSGANSELAGGGEAVESGQGRPQVGRTYLRGCSVIRGQLGEQRDP